MLTSAQISKYNNATPFEGLAKLISQKRGVVKGKYSFAVSGGAVSTINLLDDDGNEITLPEGAIITQAYIDIITAMVSSGGTGTIALNSESAGDLKAAVDADTLSGIVAGIPVGTAGTMVKMTADRKLSVAIATAALTAGRFNLFVEFVLSDES